MISPENLLKILLFIVLVYSIGSAVKLSPKWIVMKGDDIEYKLDEKFCPTYLI